MSERARGVTELVMDLSLVGACQAVRRDDRQGDRPVP